MKRRRRWARRAGLAAAALVVCAVATLGVIGLQARSRRSEAVQRVVTQACRLKTDAAGRRYLSTHDAAAGVNYIASLTEMYHRCPRPVVPVTGRRTADGSASSGAGGSTHASGRPSGSATTAGGESDDGEGGDD